MTRLINSIGDHDRFDLFFIVMVLSNGEKRLKNSSLLRRGKLIAFESEMEREITNIEILRGSTKFMNMKIMPFPHINTELEWMNQ